MFSSCHMSVTDLIFAFNAFLKSQIFDSSILYCIELFYFLIITVTHPTWFGTSILMSDAAIYNRKHVD